MILPAESHNDPSRITSTPSSQSLVVNWIRTLQLLIRGPGSNPSSTSSTRIQTPAHSAFSVSHSNLNVFGWSAGVATQPTVSNRIVHLGALVFGFLSQKSKNYRVKILNDFEGIVNEGELLLVLGPPGSGCSTLLKTLAGETSGLNVGGDVLYNAELDNHLPTLTVGETLLFAACAKSDRHVPEGVSRAEADTMLRDVVMSAIGIGHTVNTRVGNDFMRGVSGGERKRVSIAEATLAGARFQCWDNSTRGLDSANAVNFCESLRVQADIMNTAAAVAIYAIYQAPQSAYDLFNKVTLLYEGRQIFFGKTEEAKAYFEGLDFECPDRQTTPDFLTSMTSPSERIAKSGWEQRVPRTPDKFAVRWRASTARQTLLTELANYDGQHPADQRLAEFEASRRTEQAKSQRAKSEYTVSYARQVRLTWRAYRRLLADPWFTVAQLLFNVIVAVILGTLFLNLKNDSSSFYYRGGLVFFSLVLNAFASQLEVNLPISASNPDMTSTN